MNRYLLERDPAGAILHVRYPGAVVSEDHTLAEIDDATAAKVIAHLEAVRAVNLEIGRRKRRAMAAAEMAAGTDPVDLLAVGAAAKAEATAKVLAEGHTDPSKAYYLSDAGNVVTTKPKKAVQ